MINQKIRAELEYNPYLQTTKVLFNGNEPRINSLVEKYRGFILSDWVQEIPSIFHDEMNGYDFELEFTGTELDFEEVKRAFAEEGITEEQVRVFHKASLVPGIGTVGGFAVGLIGGTVGYAVTTEAYKTAMQYGIENAPQLGAKAKQIASETIDYAKANVPDKVNEITTAINDFANKNQLSFNF